MNERRCEWPGCERVPKPGKRFCSRKCGGRAAARGIAFVPHTHTWEEGPRKVVGTSSWWVGKTEAAFYTEARRRFPLNDSAVA